MRGRPAGVSPKVSAVAERLAQRIRAGDYLGAPLPSEAALAAEQGVSYLTARRAVARLVAQGLLERRPGGRLCLAACPGARPLMLGWVVPTWGSFDVLRWQRALGEAVAGQEVVLRPLLASSWQDPSLTAMAERADGLIVYPSRWGPVPESLAQRGRLVVVDRPSGHPAVPSLLPNPPEAVDALCAALAARGRRRIAWLALPIDDPVLAARRARWLACGGGPELPREREAIAAALRSGACDAILAAALPDALLALRAARDAGIAVPEQAAVAVVNDEGLGPSLVPALCAPAAPDLAAWLRGAVAWIAGDAAWRPPTLPCPCPIERRETA